MEPVTAALMAIGSGSAAGLRPYFTVFALGLAGLAIPDDAPSIVATSVDQIPDSIANPWVLIICAILALGETSLEKVPYIGPLLTFASEWLRPVFGSLVGLQLGVESGGATAALTTVLGAGSSLPVSFGKSSLSGATTLASAGTMDWLRSLLDDFGALILVVTAIVLPILSAILGLIAVGIGIALFVLFRKAYRAMKMKVNDMKQWQAEARAQRQAQIASGERVPTIQALKRLAAGATPAMATGVATSAGVMRTGAAVSASWAKSATANATHFSSASYRRASGAASSAFQNAQTRIQTPPQPKSNPQPPAPNADGMATPTPGAYPQTPPRPPMPPQEATERPNYPSAPPAPAEPPKPPQTPAWIPDGQNRDATPPPPQTASRRAQVAGERAGQAVANVKGQVGKLRGQFDGFKKGLKQSGEDTPSGDQTPPSDR